MYSLIFFISLVASLLILPILIPRLKQAGITGRDLNKPGEPEVAEMGGLGIASGFGAGVIAAIALETFFPQALSVDLIALLAALATVLIVTLIGVFDDLIRIGQRVKALTPIFAALPLMAIEAGQSAMKIPFIGRVDFGLIYPLILVPLGVTGAANAVNMLAGFNGLEVGMGTVAVTSLAIIAYLAEASTSLVLLLAALGALLVTLRYNWYPAKVLIGDVGTLSIGAIIASAVILGDFETAGVIVIIPYFLDFIIKALNRFPSTGWSGLYREGKLYCPSSRPVSLCQLIMKLSGGIRERDLVLVLMGIEALFGLIAVWIYV